MDDPVQPAPRDRNGSAQNPTDATRARTRARNIGRKMLPRAWAEGFARLLTMPRPACIPEKRWRGAIDDGARFLDDFGRQAAALGWEAGDIFGCDPHAPIARGDRLGLAFLIQGAEVSLVDQAGVVLTRGTGSLRFRRSVYPGAPVWETPS
jgi:hypothetical protein